MGRSPQSGCYSLPTPCLVHSFLKRWKLCQQLTSTYVDVMWFCPRLTLCQNRLQITHVVITVALLCSAALVLCLLCVLNDESRPVREIDSWEQLVDMLWTLKVSNIYMPHNIQNIYPYLVQKISSDAEYVLSYEVVLEAGAICRIFRYSSSHLCFPWLTITYFSVLYKSFWIF